VLLVEDNSVNQMVAVKQLQKAGCTVDVAGNGREALGAMSAARYDLVLMDCQMPEMDGYECTAEIRRREAGGRRTPVVAMTAHALPADRERCLAAGMDDYVAKPVRMEHLEAMLSRWLGGDAERSAAVLASAVDVDPATGVDGSVVDELRQVTPDGFRQLVTAFTQAGSEKIAALRRAAASGDADLMRRAAHSLKGSSGNVGATVLAGLCQRLETSLGDGGGGADVLVDEIAEAYDRARDELMRQTRPHGA
jgi:CheY-like chemotaxis protein